MPSVFPVDSGSDKESKNASFESPPGILERGLHPSRVVVCAKRELVPLGFPLFGGGVLLLGLLGCFRASLFGSASDAVVCVGSGVSVHRPAGWQGCTCNLRACLTIRSCHTAE